MTPSTKPEVHCILHYRQSRTEPQPRVTCTETFVKFWCRDMRADGIHIDRQTNIQTCRHVDCTTSPTYRSKVDTIISLRSYILFTNIKQVSAAADKPARRSDSRPPGCTQMSTVSVINWWPRPSPVYHTDRPPNLTAPETISRSSNSLWLVSTKI